MEGFVTVVYQGRRAKFGRLGYFDVYFSKSYLFLKLKLSIFKLSIFKINLFLKYLYYVIVTS